MTQVTSGVGHHVDASTLLLEAANVTMQFGGLTAVNNVSLNVHAGEIYRADRAQRCRQDHVLQLPDRPVQAHLGRGALRRRSVLPPQPRLVVRAGMARTFQNIRLFHNMTALENVMVGMYSRTKTNAIDAIFRLPRHRREELASTERARELLDFVGLTGAADMLSRNLPYGDQRRLEIARALATEPEAAAARRADRRHEPAGDPAGRGADLQDPRPRPGRAGDRARHAVHLQPVRPGGLPGARRRAGRRRRRGRAERPAGDRGLHRCPARGTARSEFEQPGTNPGEGIADA